MGRKQVRKVGKTTLKQKKEKKKIKEEKKKDAETQQSFIDYFENIGLRIVEVVQDENSFFRALAEQLINDEELY
jgi:hypothetical protein